ncbi:helix-turn-helix domain-containing protein [Bifidobacterium breve]|uniref:helix-turn-helix domain-containing protein n=1 Tax=Bifidobacterium breve TaxID=1685 RepID=UPI003DA50D64
MIVDSTRGYARLVKQRRRALGLSQGTFAAKLGVSRRWLIDFENDKVPNPGFATILRALRLLGLSLDVRQSVSIDQLADEFVTGKDGQL